MTDQERDLLRVAAWDNYLKSKTEFVAACAKLQKFREPMRIPVSKLFDNILDLREEEVRAIPDPTSFLAAFHDFRNALNTYSDAVDEARKFNWPIPVSDEPASLCRPRPRI